MRLSRCWLGWSQAQEIPMTNAERVAAEAMRTGQFHLGGEMEFPANQGPQAAYHAAAKIAEECGYSVSWRYGHSAIAVSGGDITGEYVIDWFNYEAHWARRVEHWTNETAWLAQAGKEGVT
jgi:hypothetical protein